MKYCWLVNCRFFPSLWAVLHFGFLQGVSCSVSFLVFKKNRFKIVGQILTPTIFNEWVDREGKIVLFDVYKSQKCRWFFGRRRARKRLYKTVKKALMPQSPFAVLLEHHLNLFPLIIRRIGLIIKRMGFKDLYSADSSKALLVIPRGIAQHDFSRYLLNELVDSALLAEFWELSKRVIKYAALEADKAFFNCIAGGRICPDSEGKGLFIGADPDYGWKLNGMAGHYYFAYYALQDNGLAKKKNFNRFKSEMEEILNGQRIHLRRLEPHRIFDIAEAFRCRAGRRAPRVR